MAHGEPQGLHAVVTAQTDAISRSCIAVGTGRIYRRARLRDAAQPFAFLRTTTSPPTTTRRITAPAPRLDPRHPRNKRAQVAHAASCFHWASSTATLRQRAGARPRRCGPVAGNHPHWCRRTASAARSAPPAGNFVFASHGRWTLQGALLDVTFTGANHGAQRIHIFDQYRPWR
jgi:hypothetical protein